MALISIALKMVDEYSSTITGLNQGFELVGKTLGTIKSIGETAWAALRFSAETAWSGIKKVIDLADLGGTFSEQRDQLENLANSHGKSGQKIIDVVKEISSNTITELEALPVATKAIASRLQGPDLENVLTYAKKWSEAYGGSYESAAETMFNAFSTGKYSVLKQMGLVIEKGANTDKVLRAISEGLTRFGETGFNAGDKIQALGSSYEDFWTKVGRGINDSKSFTEILGTLSDSFVEMVKSFNPEPVTLFFDSLFDYGKKFFDEWLASIPKVKKEWDSLWSDPGATIGRWIRGGIDYLFEFAKSAGDVINNVLNIISGSGIIDVVGAIAKTIITITSSTSSAVIAVIGAVVSTIASGIGGIATHLRELAQNSPMIAQTIGIDPESLAIAEVGLLKLGKGVDMMSEAIASGIESRASNINSVIDGVSKMLDVKRVDTNNILDMQKKANTALNGIDYSSKWKDTADNAKTATNEISKASKAVDDLGKAMDKPKTKKIKVAAEAGKDNSFNEIKEFLKGVNWPSEFEAMGQYLLTFVLAKAANEQIPMAVTTGY